MALGLGALCLSALSGCARTPSANPDAQAAPVAQDTSSARAPLAPIDCPMHAAHAGHDGMHSGDGGAHAHHGDKHRPFGSTEKYIEHLERADRATWQKPDEPSCHGMVE